MILGDLGAEVVKVETARGDTTRTMGPAFRNGLTAIFAQVDRNKRAITIDLKHDDGQQTGRYNPMANALAF